MGLFKRLFGRQCRDDQSTQGSRKIVNQGDSDLRSFQRLEFQGRVPNRKRHRRYVADIVSGFGIPFPSQGA